MKNIQVIIGTTRKNRASETVAQWIMKNLPATKNTIYELVDLRDWDLPFFDEALPPLVSQGRYQNEIAAQWMEKVQSADGYIIITGEYNHSIPAVLKNALDYLYSAWIAKKPVAFISYGADSGGTRAVEHLRQVVSQLQLISLHNEVNIPQIWAAFDENGSIKDQNQAEKLSNVIKELDEWFDFVK